MYVKRCTSLKSPQPKGVSVSHSSFAQTFLCNVQTTYLCDSSGPFQTPSLWVYSFAWENNHLSWARSDCWVFISLPNFHPTTASIIGYQGPTTYYILPLGIRRWWNKQVCGTEFLVPSIWRLLNLCLQFVLLCIINIEQAFLTVIGQK